MPDTWNERDFVPRAKMRWHERNFPEQWERYRFATRWIGRGQRVLDIACGSGYGTHLLSTHTGGRGLGLDIASEPIDWAKKNYGDTADFKVSSLELLATLRGQFDAVVSFETLEHMSQSDGRIFLAALAGTLKPGGRLVLSTPLNESAERLHPANPFHVREYSWLELEGAVAEKFSIERRFTQVSRLGRLRELIGGETHGTASTSASVVGSEARVAQSWRSILAQRARSLPFWKRGTFVERAGLFGGVQVVVARCNG